MLVVIMHILCSLSIILTNCENKFKKLSGSNNNTVSKVPEVSKKLVRKEKVPAPAPVVEKYEYAYEEYEKYETYETIEEFEQIQEAEEIEAYEEPEEPEGYKEIQEQEYEAEAEERDVYEKYEFKEKEEIYEKYEEVYEEAYETQPAIGKSSHDFFVLLVCWVFCYCLSLLWVFIYSSPCL